MTQGDVLSNLSKKVHTGKQLEVFKDKLGQKLLQLYSLGIHDTWTVGQINN